MKYLLKKEELTPDDAGNLKELIGTPLAGTITKLLHNRMITCTEDLVNCKWFDHRNCKARIAELQDLLYEFESYSEEQRTGDNN